MEQLSLAEMAKTANYAAMNYRELLNTKHAFTEAVGLQINPVLEEKRRDEIAKITHIYMAAMNAYDATRLEILTCLDAEGMKGTRMFTHTRDGDKQPSVVITDNNMAPEREVGDTILLLPEHVEDNPPIVFELDAYDKMIEMLSQCNEEFLDKLMSTPPRMKLQDSASTHADEIDFWEYWDSLAGRDNQEEGTILCVDGQVAAMDSKIVNGDESPSDYSYLLYPPQKVSYSTDETCGEDIIASSPNHASSEQSNEHEGDIPEDDVPADYVTWDSENDSENLKEGTVATREETLAEKAITVAKQYRLPEEVDANAPFFAEYTICFSDNGEFWRHSSFGRNLDVKDLEDFRSVSEAYMMLFLKKDVISSTDDYLVFKDDEHRIKVRLYHFPTNRNMEAKESKADSYSNCIPDYVTIDLHKTHKRMRGAIEKAKKYTESIGSTSAPFFDRYIFYDNGAFAQLKEGPDRNIVEVDSLAKIMSVLETYARFYSEEAVIISEDNCVAVKIHSDIYVVVFNYPDQKKTVEHVTKRRGWPKKSATTVNEAPVSEESASVTSTSTTQTVDDLIQKAVDLTRDLPLTNGTDVNSTYYLQSSFSVTNEGALIYNGKPFSSNVSLDDLDRCRRKHEKYARTMKASKIVAADGYTAFVYNDGKTITVYYYSTKAANACNC